MTHSPEIDKLAEALAKAQGVMEGAARDTANPFFKSKYADLASCWAACREPLSDNGLSVVQGAEDATTELRPAVKVHSILLHSSGQWIRSDLTVPVSKPDAQGYGSAITYARRYLLSAMVGIAPEDDDGEAAVGRPRAPEASRAAPGSKKTEDPREIAKAGFLAVLRHPQTQAALSAQGWNMTALGQAGEVGAMAATKLMGHLLGRDITESKSITTEDFRNAMAALQDIRDGAAKLEDFASCWAARRKPLSDNGLSVVQGAEDATTELRPGVPRTGE